MKSLDSNQIMSNFKTYTIDYFIVSSSFEERCLSLALQIKDFKFDTVIICRTVDFDKKIIENSERILELFNESSEVKIIDLFINDPVVSAINMIQQGCSELFKGSPKTVLFDITTFTHENLLVMFRILMSNRRSQDKILLNYSCAKEYSCNVSIPDNKWLTKGVKELRSIIGYPGYTDPSKKNHLIILVGFEKERTLKLIEEFDFELVTLVFGGKEDSIGQINQQINQSRHEEILNLYSNSNYFEISLTDPNLVKNKILEYISNFADYNTVIAPMNNKISTIGAGLAAIEHNEIQLFYMQANLYNTEAYSEAANEYFTIEL